MSGFLKTTTVPAISVAAQGADGYLVFFTGTSTLAGDNDLYFNRVTNQLELNSTLIARKDINVGADIINDTAGASEHRINFRGDSIQFDVNGTTNIVKMFNSQIAISRALITSARIYDNTNALNLGTTAVTGHGLTTGDVIVGGALEVDGQAWFDGNLRCNNVYLEDLQRLFFGGTTLDYTNFRSSLAQDQFILGLGTSQGMQLVITEANNTGNDYAHAQPTNPTVFFHSATAGTSATDEWLSLSHNQTDGYIAVGSGAVMVGGQILSAHQSTLIPGATTETIDWNFGNSAEIDLASATGTVTLTLSNPKAGGSYLIKIIQDAAAPIDITWPGTVLWPGGITPTISVGASAEDIVSLFFDGTSYYANLGANYS